MNHTALFIISGQNKKKLSTILLRHRHHRSGLSLLRNNNNNNNMRFFAAPFAASTCSVVALLALTRKPFFVAAAWMSTSSCSFIAKQQQHHPRSSSSSSFHFLTTKTTQSRTTATINSASSSSMLEESSSAFRGVATTVGKVIAEGAIVSSFPGGMMAVKINEDLDANDDDAEQQATAAAAAVSGVIPDRDLPTLIQKSALSSGDYQGKQVVFPNGSVGIVVAHRPPLVFCYTDTPPIIEDGQLVKVLSSSAKIAVSPLLRNVDCFGRSVVVDTTSSDDNDDRMDERPIFGPIPKVSDISLINNPMLTGTTMMDTLAPVGRGQNMLLIGHDLNQMRGLARDFLQTQQRQQASNKTTKCIYASTEIDRKKAVQRLQDAGLADDVHFVGVKENQDGSGGGGGGGGGDQVSRAAEAVIIASTACAIAESYALQKGMHSLVVVDNIDLHKTFFDSTTRVLVDVFGIDAVVQMDREGGASSEMRSFYSSLIQRAGQYNKKRGGGSVTLLLLVSIPTANADADTVFEQSDFEQGSSRVKERIDVLVKKKIPLTAANLRKLNIPIPSASEGTRRFILQHVDDLISMTDGQVWLDERLEANGQQPPIDPQRSVTRVGIGADTQSRADAPALRRIAEGMRLDLSQAASMDGAEATMASQKQIKRQRALLLAMHQPSGRGGRRLSESCAVLLAAKEGYLDNCIDNGALAGTPEGDKVIKDLLVHVQTTAANVMADIDDSLDISDGARNQLKDAIASYFQ